MAFWDAYRASLKPAEVEEPIDRWVHRPLGYVLARAAGGIGVSPDAITIGSILLAWAAAAALLASFRGHCQLGGLLIFASAVFDCADGQLARLRGSSSAFGRMLDGFADLAGTCAFAPATLFLIWRDWRTPPLLGGTVVVLGVLTIALSSNQTSMYDHYKNVWLRFTNPSFREGEDFASANARFLSGRANRAAWLTFVWRVYLFYVGSQEQYVRKFDPFTEPEIGRLPAYTPEFDAIYRREVTGPFRAMRSYYGFGSLVFALAVFNALELPGLYLVVRLCVMTPLFYVVVRRQQRAASARVFAELRAAGWAPPETGDGNQALPATRLPG